MFTFFTCKMIVNLTNFWPLKLKTFSSFRSTLMPQSWIHLKSNKRGGIEEHTPATAV